MGRLPARPVVGQSGERDRRIDWPALDWRQRTVRWGTGVPPGFVRTVDCASSWHHRFREKAGLANAAARDYNGLMEPSFDDMTKAERILYVQDLWDRIAADPEPVPLSAAQLAEVRRRLADHEAHPEASIPWEIAREQVRIRR